MRLKKNDLADVTIFLGISIDKMKSRGYEDDFLLHYKHLYLRLNWSRLKDPAFAPTPALSEDQQQLLKEDRQNGVIFPKWLPCLNGQSGVDHLPCNSHDNECRCAKLLQCDL